MDKVRSSASAAAVMGLVVAAAALLSPPAPGSFNDEGTHVCLVAAFIPAPFVVVAGWQPGAGRRLPRSCALLTRFMVLLPAVSEFFCTARRRDAVAVVVGLNMQ